jgi:hypothetical protein
MNTKHWNLADMPNIVVEKLGKSRLFWIQKVNKITLLRRDEIHE